MRISWLGKIDILNSLLTLHYPTGAYHGLIPVGASGQGAWVMQSVGFTLSGQTGLGRKEIWRGKGRITNWDTHALLKL